MPMYMLDPGSTLGAAVARVLEQPMQQQMSLYEDLAIARVTLQPLINQYNQCTTDEQRALVGTMLRGALEDITRLAERASKVQRDAVLTPATVALLATQIESIARDMFSDMPELYHGFVGRVQSAMTGVITVATAEDSPKHLRVYEMLQEMDGTVLSGNPS